MISEKLLEALSTEAIVSIVTEGTDGPHIVNTWNSYIKVLDNGDILAPAAKMNKTESNIIKNNKVLVTIGSREVEGLMYAGIGFLIEGTAKFISEGAIFDEMKEKFSWARAIIKISPKSITQTL